MSETPRDTFSSRLHEQPSDPHRHLYRQPMFADYLEYLWDPLLACNRAQAVGLAECAIIGTEERDRLLAAIDEIDAAIDPTTYDDLDTFEGPYFLFEDRLRSAVGTDLAGRLHTGRSRNDLYAAAVRLAIRERLLDTVRALCDCRAVLQNRIAETTELVMPAFTHSQPAQPITVGHYLLAIDHALARDVTRIRSAYTTTNQSPLGAAAIGGTGFPLDRDRLAELLAFDGIVVNTYDAIATVDYLLESGAALGGAPITISRVAHDLLVWSMFEIGFVELSEAMSTVSSIMPQKKNPGVLEKLRARSGDAVGLVSTISATLAARPYGDIGETWDAAKPILVSVDAITTSIHLFAAVINDIEFNEERMYDDAVTSFATMTEVADTLVREGGLSFRAAHEVVGSMVHTVHDSDRTADQVTMADLNTASDTVLGQTDLIDADALAAALDPATNVTRRSIPGGTAPDACRTDLEHQRVDLAADYDWLEQVDRRIAAAIVDRSEP